MTVFDCFFLINVSANYIRDNSTDRSRTAAINQSAMIDSHIIFLSRGCAGCDDCSFLMLVDGMHKMRIAAEILEPYFNEQDVTSDRIKLSTLPPWRVQWKRRVLER